MKPETWQKIQDAKKKRLNANQCTKDNPMPKGAEGEWFHNGAARKEGQSLPKKIGDSSIWLCPNCGHEFVVTLRRL